MQFGVGVCFRTFAYHLSLQGWICADLFALRGPSRTAEGRYNELEIRVCAKKRLLLLAYAPMRNLRGAPEGRRHVR